jgi:hypothetical protein
MGEEPQRAAPVCEFPKCDGAGTYQIFSQSGKPLSINRKGELVFGDAPPLGEHAMSPNEKARALAGLPVGLEGIVGPSGVAVPAATLAPKSVLNVCHVHRVLPHAPKEPKKRYLTGPYASHQQAAARAHTVGARTRVTPEIRSQKVAGVDQWYVMGDDGERGYKGSLVEWDGK